jgi:DNA-binding response OmpR family regulator
MTILIGDDDENDATLMIRALRKASFTGMAHVLRDGEQVLHYLQGAAPFNDREKYPRANLLILDLKMPRLSGFEILNWLQAQPQSARVPAVILTGAPSAEDSGRAFEAGACGVFEKPVNLRELEQVLLVIYQYWSRNKSPLNGA